MGHSGRLSSDFLRPQNLGVAVTPQGAAGTACLLRIGGHCVSQSRCPPGAALPRGFDSGGRTGARPADGKENRGREGVAPFLYSPVSQLTLSRACYPVLEPRPQPHTAASRREPPGLRERALQMGEVPAPRGGDAPAGLQALCRY